MSTIEQLDPKPYSRQAAGTSYYGFGGDAALQQHVHIQWDAALIATITFEVSDFREVPVSVAPVRPGDWVPSSSTQIEVVPGSATITGASAINIPGGTAGGGIVKFFFFAVRRGRVKVVCTTPGNLRIAAGGKQ